MGEKKTQPLLIDSKEIGHETDAEKAKYMFVFRQKTTYYCSKASTTASGRNV